MANVGNYAFQAIAGRMLTVAEFGVMNTLIGICGASLIPAGALGTSISRWVAMCDASGNHRAVSTILRRACRRICFCLLGFILVFALAEKTIQDFLRLPALSPLVIAAIWIVAGLFVGILSAGLQGLRRFGWVAALIVSGVAARLLFGFLLMNAGHQSSGALGGMVAANLMTVAIAVVILWPILRVKSDPDFYTRPIYRYLFPVALPMTVWSLLGSADLIIVKHYFSPVSAGHYAAAGLFGRALGTVVTPITLVLFPEWSRMSAQGSDPSSHRPLLLKCSLVVALVGVAAAAVCTLWPQWPVLLLKGRSEPPTEALLPPFVWAMVPLSIAWVPYTYRLATASIRHLYRLLPVFFLYLGALMLWHATLTQVLGVVACGGVASLAALWLGTSPVRAADVQQETL